jgi:glyoxylase-like metal-dependent hydrolase (beta-lactamase superfamily II)
MTFPPSGRAGSGDAATRAGAAARLAPGLAFLDVQFQGRPQAIATAVIGDAGGVALIDPGPTTCLAALELGLNGAGLQLAQVTDILLTHIHLDHAGATGTIVRRHPAVRVHVHERGARHMIDPARLLASATRLYGTEMDRLWGEFAAVPATNVRALAGGERIAVAGRQFEVAYTPGHASHHVSYFDRESGVAFVGDTGGVCIDGGYVLPPTPPPDIDVELWRRSAARIEAWSPATLFLTHFGPVTQPRAHLGSLVDNLDRAAAWVRASLDRPIADEERGRAFADALGRDLRRSMTDTQLAAYLAAAPPGLLWQGLARYVRTRG